MGQAADGKLNLGIVLGVAFAGCLAGRAIGFRLGATGGRALLEHTGWFESFRRRAVAKGQDLCGRYPRAAVLIAPPPISGIHDVPVRTFALASVAVGLLWTLSTGLLSYLVGEQARSLLTAHGVRVVLVIAGLTAVALGARYLLRARSRSRVKLTEE